MKPTEDQNSSPPEGGAAWIEAALHETAHAHITDAGFSARVTAALPARRSAWGRWRGAVVVGVAGLVGGAIALGYGGAELEQVLARAGEALGGWLVTARASLEWIVLAAGALVAATVIGVSNWRLWRQR